MRRPSHLHHHNRTRTAQRPGQPIELLEPLFGREKVEKLGDAHGDERCEEVATE